MEGEEGNPSFILLFACLALQVAFSYLSRLTPGIKLLFLFCALHIEENEFHNQ